MLACVRCECSSVLMTPSHCSKRRRVNILKPTPLVILHSLCSSICLFVISTFCLSPIAGLQLHSLVFCPSVVIESIFMQGWSRFTFMFKVDTIRPSLAVLYKIIAFKPLQVNTFLVTVIRIDVQI